MKKNIFKQFILFLFIIFCKQTTAQQFFIKNYTVENGLPTRMINDACQDKDGNMWFATYYGLSKYDGFSFTNYSIENGLPVKSYRKLRLDKKGVLWATPYNTNSKLIYLKKIHVGYYLVDNGKKELLSYLTNKKVYEMNYEERAKLYVYLNFYLKQTVKLIFHD